MPPISTDAVALIVYYFIIRRKGTPSKPTGIVRYILRDIPNITCIRGQLVLASLKQCWQALRVAPVAIKEYL
jgi:hypothetical protein